MTVVSGRSVVGPLEREKLVHGGDRSRIGRENPQLGAARAIDRRVPDRRALLREDARAGYVPSVHESGCREVATLKRALNVAHVRPDGADRT